MAKTLDLLAPRAGLIETARIFYQRGWMAGTAGNLSVRAANTRSPAFWITGSGLPKGQLEESDFLLAAVDNDEVLERPKPSLKPSAETAIHRAIYARVTDATACLHVHTVDAIVAVRRHAPTSPRLKLPPVEMVKGLDIWDERPNVDLAIFENAADVGKIAAEIDAFLSQGTPRVPAVMIKDHGITVWGRSLQEAFNRIEIMEYIFGFLARTTSSETGWD